MLSLFINIRYFLKNPYRFFKIYFVLIKNV
jgi:hypothetical protein